MKIPLDRQAKQPIYLQIRDRIHHLIHTGHLPPNSQLPSIRTLAQTANVNKLTVVEAYSVLEADGLVRAKQGAGYFINSPRNAASTPLSHRAISHSEVGRSGTGNSEVGFQEPSHQEPSHQEPSHQELRHRELSGAEAQPPRSAFNPTQQVIIPKGSINSFSEIYHATIAARDQPDIVDFGIGFPQPIDVDDFQRVARRAMKDSDVFFCKGEPKGDFELRGQISQLLMQQGLEVSAENLIVTSGSMQALALLADHFIQPGDRIITEAPTYHGFLSILQQRSAQIIGIPMTATGINLELLAQYLDSHRPKLIYTISTLHNPTGITTTIAHRRQLLALAQQYNCLVIEDNAYEPLSFETTPPPIKAFDTTDQVIYVGTFSKTLMPGLRVGYMAITGEQNAALTERKLLHDFHLSNASQAIVKEYLASGHYRRRLKRLRALHKERRDYMLALLSRYVPPTVMWTLPAGGTFLWIQLPEMASVNEVTAAAAAQKVLLGSGSAFFPKQQGYPALRLNFSLPPEETERGIRILGSILHSLKH
ncbi:MAG: PLP-dependent aminotransferase family protein [Phormidesmis sp.]